jgi:hypothetical protein
MSETNVIPLTQAERSRRHRRKKKAEKAATKTATEAETKPERRPERKPQRRPSVAALAVAATTGSLLLVSLTHVSQGVTALTGCTVAEAWAMSVGIDAMLCSVLYALLSADDATRHAIHVPAIALEVQTLVASAYLNSLADSGGHWDLEHAPAICFGCFIPAAVALGSAILARLK